MARRIEADTWTPLPPWRHRERLPVASSIRPPNRLRLVPGGRGRSVRPRRWREAGAHHTAVPAGHDERRASGLRFGCQRTRRSHSRRLDAGGPTAGCQQPARMAGVTYGAGCDRLFQKNADAYSRGSRAVSPMGEEAMPELAGRSYRRHGLHQSSRDKTRQSVGLLLQFGIRHHRSAVSLDWVLTSVRKCIMLETAT